MPQLEATRAEAERQLRVCSACMYCDGFCAVFPAIAGRSAFSPADLAHLATLCHNCRGCWSACQYAPPHQLDINLPRVLADQRQDTYAEFVRPRWLAVAFRRPGLVSGLAMGITTALLLAWVLITVPADVMFSVQVGEGAFYRVIPWGLMAGLAGASFLFAIVSISASSFAFWRATAPKAPARIVLRAIPRMLADVITLRNLGSGPGCNDVDENWSRARRWSHQTVVAGFAGTVLATVSAAVIDHVTGVKAPYDLVSLPVIAGTLGGVVMLVGLLGLSAIARRAEREPAAARELAMNRAFRWSLVLVTASGLAVLGLRETVLMGVTLTVHIGIVIGFFLALPAGKMLHAPFRALALLRASIDRLVKPPRRSGGE